jgi:hypothetical protein
LAGDSFLESRSAAGRHHASVPGEIMPDYLYLSARGYDIWGKASKGDIEKLVK